MLISISIVLGLLFPSFFSNTHSPTKSQIKSTVVAENIGKDSAGCIILERLGCWGTCPVYSVRIANDGTGDVHFHGGYNHQNFDTLYHISPKIAAEVIRSTEAAGFMAINNSYINSEDTYESSITIKFPASEKKVTFDDRGLMYTKLECLASNIDSAAMTRNLPY